MAGARGEAHDGFPHARRIGLPALDAARARGLDETGARLDALIAIIASLDDTCLLHRGGRNALAQLDAALLALNASPGGAADLLAATLFLDSLRGLA